MNNSKFSVLQRDVGDWDIYGCFSNRIFTIRTMEIEGEKGRIFRTFLTDERKIPVATSYHSDVLEAMAEVTKQLMRR